ncbi:hypothetical protein R2F25_30275 [Streptomyces sp. UP1A-1]|nr:hypothetical protein [Streptomyces sp. UP1A-1]
MSTAYDEPFLDDEPDEYDAVGLTDDELAAAIEWLHGGRDPLAFYPTPVTRRRKPNAVGRTVTDVRYQPRTAPYPQTVRNTVDSTTRNPIAGMYQAALDALRSHPNYADAMAAALDAVRAWRHQQPHTAAVDFAPLDAVLDAAALSADVPLPQHERPASLSEAVVAHRAVMEARRQALAAVRLVWDGIEAAAIREIDRHLPHPSVATEEITADATELQAALREGRRK